MIVYLASPNTQQQAEHLSDMPVLLSFSCFSDWLYRYQQSFSQILIDSGAFSEFNSGVKIDVGEYKEWSERWLPYADAIAGVDDISGDWKKSLANYQSIPWGFPTWHDTDPLGLIDDLVSMSKERHSWIGIGLKPPRHNKETEVRKFLERVPEGVHVHGWALRKYMNLLRLDSVDSTNWWRDAMKIRGNLPWLTYGEALEIVVKRYKRNWRMGLIEAQPSLFEKKAEQLSLEAK